MLKSIKMFLPAYAVALPISALIFVLIVNGAPYFSDPIMNVMAIIIAAGFALYVGLSCGFYVEDVLIRTRKISMLKLIKFYLPMLVIATPISALIFFLLMRNSFEFSSNQFENVAGVLCVAVVVLGIGLFCGYILQATFASINKGGLQHD